MQVTETNGPTVQASHNYFTSAAAVVVACDRP